MVTTLIDTGAISNVISEELVQRLQLPVEPVVTCQVTGALHGSQRSCDKGIKITLHTDSWTYSTSALVVPGLKRYLILGMPFVQANAAHIDFQNLTFSPTPLMPLIATGANLVPVNVNPTTPLLELNALDLLRQNQEIVAEQLFLIRVDVQALEPSPSMPPNELSMYSDILVNDMPNELPPLRTVNHDINLEPGLAPPYKQPYRLSFDEQTELKRQLTDMLAKGFIRPSHSPFGAPVLFVQKKDGSKRLCVDYRALNRQTVKNRYPLPLIDDVLDHLAGAKWFTTLDLHSGYHQVRITPQDIPKTAFRTKYGHYEYVVMPFGLCNAPATFQRLMNDLLRDFLDDFVCVYLDDIIVFSPDRETHLVHVTKVLDCLRAEKLYVKLKKCSFFQRSVEYLGHIVTPEGVKVDPKKVEVVKNWPQPQNSRELLSFLGLAGYFRRFIPHFSKIAQPLYQLTQQSVKFEWSPACQESFQHLRLRLTSAPVLRLPNKHGTFIVSCDASGFAVGAMLEQVDAADQKPHVIAYFSKKMTPSETRYPIREQELLALVAALKHWEHYLRGRPFIVYTDHQSLIYIQTQKHLTGRLARWHNFMVDFEFEVRYRPGKNNPVADALSRAPDLELNLLLLDTISPDHQRQIKDAYSLDPTFEPIFTLLKTGNPVPKALAQTIKHYRLVDDFLFYTAIVDDWPHERLCLPDCEYRRHVLHDSHDAPIAGHPGLLRTYLLLQDSYYWPAMKRHIQEYIRKCRVCQQSKHSTRNQSGLLQPLPVPLQRWEEVTLDFVSGIPRTSRGNDCVLTFTDRLSKRAHFVPTQKTCTAEMAAKLYFDNVVRLHGISKVFISDRDVRFINPFWKTVHALMGTKLNFTAANHPEADGQSERTNETMIQLLRLIQGYTHANPQDWDLHLTAAEIAYNNYTQGSTHISPYELDTGCKPRLPGQPRQIDEQSLDASNFIEGQEARLKLAQDLLAQAQDAQAKYANRHRHQQTFSPGDYVLVHKNWYQAPWSKEHDKLGVIWHGPLKVLKKIDEKAYVLELPEVSQKHRVFPIVALRKFYYDGYPKISPQNIQEQIMNLPDLERLIDRKTVRSRFGDVNKYLAVWKDCDPNKPSWVSYSVFQYLPADKQKVLLDDLAFLEDEENRSRGEL